MGSGPPSELAIEVLGPLTVRRGGVPVDLGPPRQRAVLAVLAIHADEVVSVDRLVDALWSEPPASAMGTLQAYVSNLRRILEPGRAARQSPSVLVTQAPGYRLRIDRRQLDAFAFEDGLAIARDAAGHGRWLDASAALDEALARWHGAAMADFEQEDFTQPWRARFDGLRASAEELRAEALLARGRLDDALTALDDIVARHPLHEHPRTLQVLALAAAGRQADALRAFERARSTLVEELGIDPGPELREAYRRVLEQDPALAALAPPQRPAVEPAAAATPAPAPAASGRRRAGLGGAMVGRTGDLRRLVHAGRPGFAIVSGEAGIGKTRLAEELLDVAAERANATGLGRCHHDDGAPPLWPWRQLLRDLGLDVLGAGAQPSSSADAYELFDRVRRELESLAAQRPVTIVLDDVQWADQASLRLLSFLADELRTSETLVVVTLRDTEVGLASPVRAAMARLARANAVHVALRGLDGPDVAELVAGVDGTRPDGAALAALVNRTAGNPLFVLELARSGLVTAAQHEVPSAVGDVVRVRLRGLPEEAQLALAMAAALGRSFDIAVLAAAIGRDVPATSEALDDALAARVLVADEEPGRLRFAHALVADAILGDGGPMRAARLHVRAADALQGARTDVPGITAAEIARQLDRAAHQLGPSLAARARAAAIDAADEAAALGGFDDAASWLELALAHARAGGVDVHGEIELLGRIAVARIDAGLRADAAGAADAQHRALHLARTLRGDERSRALADAATLVFDRTHTWQWRAPGERDQAVVDALETALAELPGDDLVRRCRVLASLAVELLATPTGPARADALSAEAVALARAAGDVELFVRAVLARALALDVPGRGADRVALIDEAIATGDQGLDPRLLAVLLTWRAGSEAQAGGPLGLGSASLDLRALTTELRHPVVQLTARWAATMLAYLRPDFPLAARRALTAYRLHRGVGDWEAVPAFVVHDALRRRELAEVPDRPEDVLPEALPADELRQLDGLRLWWTALRNRPDEADDAVRMHAPRVLEWRGAGWLQWMSWLVEAGRTADSRWLSRLYDELLPHRNESVFRWPYPNTGSVEHYLGIAAAGLGRPDLAVDHFDEAARCARRVPAVPWIWRAEVERLAALRSIDPAGAAARAAIAVPELARLGLVDLGRRARAVAGLPTDPA